MDILPGSPTQVHLSNPVDTEERWFTIYVHTCDADPRGYGERPTEGKQYVGQTMHALRDLGLPDAPERALQRRWRQKSREKSVLAEAVRQFGADKFRHEIVAVVQGQTAANLLEDELILKLDSLEPHGYNRKRGGQSALTHVERSEFCRRGWAKIPTEHKKDKARRGRKTLGPEGRSAAASKRASRMSPARLSEIARKGNATKGPAARKAASRKAMSTMGPKGLREKALKAKKTLGTEGCRAAIRKAKETMGPERRTAARYKANATMGLEGMQAAKRKRDETLGVIGLRRAVRRANCTKWLKAFRRAISARNDKKLSKLLDVKEPVD